MRARGLQAGVTIRRSDERGRTTSEWLDSRHSFAFGTYERVWNGLGALKVLNEDRIAPGRGFARHPHWDMEILTYVLEGAVEHDDDHGVRARVAAGEAQLMSAGTGIEHAERNASPTAPLRLFQAWIVPAEKGRPVAHQHLPARPGALRCLAAPDGSAGREGAMTLAADASVWVGHLEAGERTTHELAAGRRAWVQVADGALTVELAGAGAARLAAGDGAAWIELGGRGPLELLAEAAATRFLLFDLG